MTTNTNPDFTGNSAFWNARRTKAFDGLDPGAAMTKANPVPTCDFGHGEMGPDVELDQDGEPTGKLLWTCQVCCWSLPRGNIKWADSIKAEPGVPK